MPTSSATERERSAVRAEADATLASEPLHVDHAPEEDRIPAVLGFEGEGAVAPRSRGRGRARPPPRRRDEHRQHLRCPRSAISMRRRSMSPHRPPTLPGPRRSPPDERTRPGARTDPTRGSWSIRRTPSRRAAGRARPGGRRPRTRRGASPGHGRPGSGRPANRPPSGRSSSIRDPPMRSEAASTPWSGTSARCSSTAPKSRS